MSQKKQVCRKCGCTDDDCRGCVAKTGEPCHWAEDDLCSACVPDPQEKQFFLDQAAIAIYSQKREANLAYVRAEELWEARQRRYFSDHAKS